MTHRSSESLRSGLHPGAKSNYRQIRYSCRTYMLTMGATGTVWRNPICAAVRPAPSGNGEPEIGQTEHLEAEMFIPMRSVRNDIRVDDDGLPCADVHHWAEEAVRKLPARYRIAVKGLSADSKAEVRMGEVKD
jgi:hypothetical protein